MTELWLQFEALDVASKAVVVGLVVTAIMGLLKKLWPAFDESGAAQKFAVAVVLAALTGYAAGGWPAALLAVLVALGGGDVSKNLTKTCARLMGGQ